MNKQENETKKMTNRQKLSVLNQWETYMTKIFSKQHIAEKAIYSYLFWRTIGTGTREYQVSYKILKQVTGIKAELTLSKHINNLIKKRHLKLVKRKFNIPSIYRVYSPLEIVTPDKHDKKSKKGSK